MLFSEIGLFALLLVASLLSVDALSRYVLINQRQHFPAMRFFDAILLLISLSFASLIMGFVLHDYGLRYVYEHASLALPWFFQLSTIWSGHAGSWLLWLVISSGYACVLARQLHRLGIANFHFGGLSALLALYTIYALYAYHPFARILPIAPGDGLGMNPLLQDSLFMIHPPCLYLGLAATIVPWSIARQWHLHPQQASLIRLWQQWTYLAWGFLTLGITLGSLWAYAELGWGGWWFWDPVENAALMPWLVLTAMMHMGSHPQHVSGLSCVRLSYAAVLLTLLGTWVTRSGAFVSVHSFAMAGTSAYLLLSFSVFIVLDYCRHCYDRQRVFIPIPAALHHVTMRNLDWRALQTMLMCMAVCFVFIGTFYPLCMRGLLGREVVIANTFYHTALWPLAVLLSLAMLMQTLSQRFLLVHAAWLLGFVLFILLCVFAYADLWHLGVWSFLWLGLLSYGLLVHGVCLFQVHAARLGFQAISHGLLYALALVITINTMFDQSYLMPIHTGQRVQQGDLQIVLSPASHATGHGYQSMMYPLSINWQGRVFHLQPEIRQFTQRAMAKPVAAIHHGFFYDVYAVLTQTDAHDYVLRVYIKPLQNFFWIFGILLGFMALYRSMSFSFLQSRK